MTRDLNNSRHWRNPAYSPTRGGATVAESLCRGQRLRELVRQGLALGTFLIEQPCPSTLAVLSTAGFDFVVLDMEHSAIGISGLEPLILAGQAAGLVVLVRTLGQDTALISKVLDMGAHGVMAPHVDTAERARQIVDAARFRPEGNRGFSPLARFDGLQEPLAALGDSAFVVVQIEGRSALDRVADIAAVPGIDALFVGPYDLSLSLGVPPGSPAVSEAAERIAAAVPVDLGLGIYVDDPADSPGWAARRFALQCVSFDGRMLAEGARRVAARARAEQSDSDGVQGAA